MPRGILTVVAVMYGYVCIIHTSTTHMNMYRLHHHTYPYTHPYTPIVHILHKLWYGSVCKYLYGSVRKYVHLYRTQ